MLLSTMGNAHTRRAAAGVCVCLTLSRVIVCEADRRDDRQSPGCQDERKSRRWIFASERREEQRCDGEEGNVPLIGGATEKHQFNKLQKCGEEEEFTPSFYFLLYGAAAASFTQERKVRKTPQTEEKLSKN